MRQRRPLLAPRDYQSRSTAAPIVQTTARAASTGRSSIVAALLLMNHRWAAHATTHHLCLISRLETRSRLFLKLSVRSNLRLRFPSCAPRLTHRPSQRRTLAASEPVPSHPADSASRRALCYAWRERKEAGATTSSPSRSTTLRCTPACVLSLRRSEPTIAAYFTNTISRSNKSRFATTL